MICFHVEAAGTSFLIYWVYIQQDGQEELGDNYMNTTCCVVTLTMKFEMTNPLIPLALPFLSIDNNLALNILLPKAVSRK